MFLKCWQQKQLFSGTAIFKEHLSLAATLYYLSVLNQNLYCLRILQIIVKILLKNAHSKTFKRHFNTNTLWNLEFAIFDFTRYKTFVHRARFPYSSLMRAKQNQIYLLWFISVTVLCKFHKKSTPRFFSYNRHWPLHFKGKLMQIWKWPNIFFVFIWNNVLKISH